jgi:CheY-like chemotaxis protein
VLVVDDDHAVATLTGEYFQREDDVAEVTVETNARDALRIVDADSALDAIVCDFKMPGMDGLDLFEAVRERRPDLPFVLFTGSAKYQLEDRSSVEEVDAVVIKDGDRGRYRHLVDEVVTVATTE